MFYSQFILAKKGPLGTIWIAAHLERKLRKNQVADTDIGVSVDSILCPDIPIALRLSSHLLLGVVRIYSRKVNYLFDDCSEALLKVKQAFRSTAVDLPPEQSKAPYHSITLPETFDLDDFELPDNEIFQGNDRHVSTREQITLQDTLDGASFPTSQFGPDERFGDGDASQIGLDLDEDLFLEKGDAVGAGDVLNSIDIDPSSAKEATSTKDDEPSEMVSDFPLASSTNYLSIQAPSTPGLVEEPNLPSVEEALVSDEHMDEDQNIPELAAKELPGTTSSHTEPSRVESLEFDSNGNCHQLDEKDNEQVKSEKSILSDKAVESVSRDNVEPFKSMEHSEATSPFENDGVVAADGLFVKGHCDNKDADLNRSESVIFSDAHDQDTGADGGKADLNSSYLPYPDMRSEKNDALADKEVLRSGESEKIVVDNGYQRQESHQACQDLEISEMSKNDGSEKLSVFNAPVLTPCNSHSHKVCGVEILPDASRLSAEEDGADGLCSFGLSSKKDATFVAEILTDRQDLTTPTMKADQIPHEDVGAITCSKDRPLTNDSFREDHLEKENNSDVSEFSAPEKLLSMPNLPSDQPDNALVECAPGREVVTGDGDASFEDLLSGKKRSYTESTLTIQSLNSAASSGATQSKQSAELVPEDDDLLSSILGGRSTTFQLKPTPTVSESLPSKRQRTSIRPSAQKRKVLMDDSMVLHGDMIREQLTNTEDIRRVRKKAPCTHLEVWVLQKQFLEDEVFSEPVFTGLLPEFGCLHNQPLDLSVIKIIQDGGSKGTNEKDTTNESVLVVDALQKELETFDNEVAKQMSKQGALGKKTEMENHTEYGSEENPPVASTVETTSSVDPVPEITCDLTDNVKVDTPCMNETIDAIVPMDIDTFRQSINQDNNMEFNREDACTMEEASGSGRENREVEDRDIDDKLDGHCLLETRECVDSADTIVVLEDVVGTCSSPVYDIPITDSVNMKGRAPPTSERTIEECQLGEPRIENEEEIIASDTRHDDNHPTSDNFLDEGVKLDPSHVVETDLSPLNIKTNEKEDLHCLNTEPTHVTDPIIPDEFMNSADRSDFMVAEVIEHDTDFLNVDDDDVAEDYENDAPNPEEKCLLDNSGWSSRTRAVANYLQVLFEKETHQPKKVIPLESLLAGKTRKEASRLFFETLVLKTKDYIHAEQESSFCDIKIKATAKLMKSEF